jgi:uncharacterized iron-regulated membrane protein
MTDQATSDFSGSSSEPISDAGAASLGPVQHPLAYFGQAKSLGWLVFKNKILTIITPGFYRFWSKTRIRKCIWGANLFLANHWNIPARVRSCFSDS